MEFQTKIFSQSTGAKVTTHKGEYIGKVTEVKRDSTGKKIEYIVISTNKLFGNRTRYFAVPVCSSLINMTGEGRIMLYIDKDSLQIATGVHARDCPKINPEFSDSILELYHYEASKSEELKVSGESVSERQYA